MEKEKWAVQTVVVYSRWSDKDHWIWLVDNVGLGTGGTSWSAAKEGLGALVLGETGVGGCKPAHLDVALIRLIIDLEFLLNLHNQRSR